MNDDVSLSTMAPYRVKIQAREFVTFCNIFVTRFHLLITFTLSCVPQEAEFITQYREHYKAKFIISTYLHYRFT